MIEGDGREVGIYSDLRLESGDAWATLVADGSHLRLVTNDAGLLWTQAGRTPLNVDASLREIVRRAGAALDQAGLSAEVLDPHGRLVQLGRSCGSPAGRLLFGSPHVGLGRPRVLGAVAYRHVRTSQSMKRLGLSVTLVVTALAAARRGLRHWNRRGNDAP